MWSSLLWLLLIIEYSKGVEECSERSCYPATGNLLVGRKHRLTATSTCGLHGRQRYCIVSHLDDQTKCFYCDSRTEWKPHREPNKLSHRVENIVKETYEERNRNWWQSENGIQSVSIQLDLEAEFHFTHLIMTFKSFRPAAMVIERSADFGKTWTPYRYFAYDCPNTFPDIPEDPPKNHSDVICTRKYSDVAPSTGGEVVYKVLSPHIPTENPYSADIADLIKLTTLRINFTKLHTLGDDLLDYRPEIDEKYYYAIYELVVRGSCSCYGHASRCIPIDGQQDSTLTDMVHGRCECTHNTKGLNCEQCGDFFNDLPWRPALGNSPNECRVCNCNGHARGCHFDRAVYEASGMVSGGVCDDCMHNTQGKNCEQCRPYFYRDPLRPITDPYVCLPCHCDKNGSLNDGICEGEQDDERGLVAGKCYCKPNALGPHCDRCKNGYWQLSAIDPNGCRACECNLLGSFNNEGCDKNTGMCTCKRLVTGERCDRCLDEHYGLSEEADGCKACDCDLGGALSNQCDVATGQCSCRPHFSGRRCDTADSGFFCAQITHYLYEAEQSNITQGEVVHKELPATVRDRVWTGEGFARLGEGGEVAFRVGDIQQSMLYAIVIRHEAIQDSVGWQNVAVTIVRPGDPSPSGPCGHVTASDDFIQTRFHPQHRYVEIRPEICLEQGVEYTIRLRLGDKRSDQPDRSASVLIDSLVLAPPIDALSIFSGSNLNDYHRTEYERYQCRGQALALTPAEDLSETCLRYLCPVAAVLLPGAVACECDPTGSVSGICRVLGGQCECKANVVGRKCDRCAIGTYGFGPSGCSPCDCDSVGALSNVCDKRSGQCQCRERGITGRQCNQCQPGFWSFPDCRVCQCNDHASVCDQRTGACIECRDLTDGHFCDRCMAGYYGDPRLGVNLPCKPCPCPGGPGSGYQHADTCYLDHASQSLVCNCRAGYSGERCAECAPNHWGVPNEVGGSCERCDCNGNIDVRVEESCDAHTGACLKCLHNTQGTQCELCQDGFFGDAKLRSCQRCVCNGLGTNSSAGHCNRFTGQCPCLPNVVGEQCDQCAPDHFDLASGTGCSMCACDPTGVIESMNGPHLQCNHISGQCNCKRGRGGRTCGDCEDLYWGDAAGGECKRCECDPTGSASQQCDRHTGICSCLPGSGGRLCNECSRGFTGQWPHCHACGQCFHDWDKIIQGLQERVTNLIAKAENIEDTGVSSVYDGDFIKMEGQLDQVRAQLASVNVSKQDVDGVQHQIAQLHQQVEDARARLSTIDTRIMAVSNSVDGAEEDMHQLEEKAIKLTKTAQEMSENTTRLREADAEGAFNITRESAEKSSMAKLRTDSAAEGLNQAETERRDAQLLFDKNQADFEKQYSENQLALDDVDSRLSFFESSLPKLNEQVCGAKSAPCDAVCGGAGSCDHCGGKSCMAGSVSIADQAEEFAVEADKILNQKQRDAEQLLTRLRQTLMSTATASVSASSARQLAEAAVQQANQTKNALEILNEMQAFLETEHSTPEQIRALADEISRISISHSPDHIDQLSKQIREKLREISNIDAILDETRGNKTVAGALQAKAEAASRRSEAIRNTTTTVREALNRAMAAQGTAKTAIADALNQIAVTRTDLGSANEETTSAETILTGTNTSLTQLETEIKGVRIQNLQITEQAKNAYADANKAQKQAADSQMATTELQKDFDTARQLLEKKQTGNEVSQNRAELLRKRATSLLQNTQRHRQTITQLIADMDASELKMSEYQHSLNEMNGRIDSVTFEIHRRLDFYSTCDV